jgi:hypothetical protein
MLGSLYAADRPVVHIFSAPHVNQKKSRIARNRTQTLRMLSAGGCRPLRDPRKNPSV